MQNQERCDSREPDFQIDRRGLLKGAVVGAAAVVALRAVERYVYPLERINPFADTEEKNLRLSDTAVWDEALGISDYTGSYLLVGLTSKGGSRLKPYSDQRYGAAEKVFQKKLERFDNWKPASFTYTNDSKLMEMGEYAQEEGRDSLYILDRTNSRRILIEENNGNKTFESPTISLNGFYESHVRFTKDSRGEKDNRTIVVSKVLDGGVRYQEISADKIEHPIVVAPIFSPDEKSLAYVLDENVYPEKNPHGINQYTPVLYVRNLEDGSTFSKPLFEAVGSTESIAWSRDSSKIAAVSSVLKDGYIHEKNLLTIAEVATQNTRNIEFGHGVAYYEFLGSTEGNEFVIVEQDQDSDTLDLLVTYSQNGSVKSKVKCPNSLGGTLRLVRSVDEGKYFAICSPSEDKPFSVNIETGQVSRLSAKGAGAYGDFLRFSTKPGRSPFDSIYARI